MSNTTLDTPIKGVTRMTSDSHNFDGYAVRRGMNNFSFLRYIGAGRRKFPTDTVDQRFTRAKTEAAVALNQLDTVLADPKSWRKENGKKILVKKYALVIRNLGFKIKSPAP